MSLPVAVRFHIIEVSHIKNNIFNGARDIIARGGDVTDAGPVTDLVANFEHDFQLSPSASTSSPALLVNTSSVQSITFHVQDTGYLLGVK